MSKRLLLLVPIIALSISACGSSKWQSHFEDGQIALKGGDGQLKSAENAFRLAVADAEKNGVPAPRYEPALAALGRTLMREGKYVDAQEYLIRAVGLASGTRMNVTENASLLRELSSAYEKAGNYHQALQTHTVLLTLLEMEKSPFDPDYKKAKAEKQVLSQKMAALHLPL